jgi:hypothetical protein
MGAGNSTRPLVRSMRMASKWADPFGLTLKPKSSLPTSAEQRAGREAGLAAKGCIVAGHVLVERRLDAARYVIEQHRRRVDREAVVAVGAGSAEAELLCGQVALGHADHRQPVREGAGWRGLPGQGGIEPGARPAAALERFNAGGPVPPVAGAGPSA